MVIETRIKPENNLAIAVDSIAEEVFRKRRTGQLIAITIATTNRKMDDASFFKRDQALRELSQYFPAKRLTSFIAHIEDPIARREPIVRSLLLYP